MFLNRFLIFCFLDAAYLFPLKNCKTLNIALLALLDCRGECEEQKLFIKTFEDFWHTNTNTRHRIFTKIINEFERNKTISIPSIMMETKEWYESYTCYHSPMSFIFVFNTLDIKNDTNSILNDIVKRKYENSAYNRIFIIQSSEKTNHVYSSEDFIYFTSSFQDLDIEDIYKKICDMNIDTLVYTRKGNVTSEYRIVNQLSEMSSTDADCYCYREHDMDLLSLETYSESNEIIQYIKTSSVENTHFSKGINVYLNLNYFPHEGFRWRNDNPFVLSYPLQKFKTSYSCFYLNLSTNIETSLLGNTKMYDIGNFLVEIECQTSLQQSLVVCEDMYDISWTYMEALHKNIFRVPNKVILSHIFFDFIPSYLSGKQDYSTYFYLYNCNSNSKKNGHNDENYLCDKHLSTQSDNETNKLGNSFVYILMEGSKSFSSLGKIDISKCEKNSECRTITYNQKDDEMSNKNTFIFCGNDKGNKTFDDQCFVRTFSSDFSLQYLQCESNKSQYSLKCIKDYDNQCEDNSHLIDCETFSCPETFFKCPKSFCLLPSLVNNNKKDCPYGEDEFKWDWGHYLCTGVFTLHIRDFCMSFKSFDFFLPTIANTTQFVCDNVCPINHTCISSKIKENVCDKNNTKYIVNHLYITSALYQVLGVVSPEERDVQNEHLSTIISFKGRECDFSDFDLEFRHWKFDDLFILDISSNKINNSIHLKSVEHFLLLKLLNLSHNEDLIIEESFNFPRALEIIDLSYTKTKVLRKNIFRDLVNLRHLNLSSTSITQFKDMGLPDYFTLDTLYIKFLEIQDIHENFFKGLTITSKLMASDFVLCCPQIKNSNISDKNCHAPLDFISSCKHLVGDTFKRIVIWVVGLLTIIGNGIVLVYRIGWNREIFKKAYGLFITGLAISDFIMGVYLMIIASVDVYYKDVYVLDEFKWRNSFLCNLCGFLSALSSETSTFFICLITLDRFLCITYPFGQHRFSKNGKLLSLTLVWFVGFVLALIPVVLSDWDIYSSNGLCLALPLSPTQNQGWGFSFAVFVGLNFILFLIIAIGQLTIFINLIKGKKSIISRENIQRRSEDLSVAKKLAFVALSDFCCWFPVGILGFFSLNGYIFNREVYAWIAVFVLPINSALNPIIYTIPAVYNKCQSLSNRNSYTFQSKL